MPGRLEAYLTTSRTVVTPISSLSAMYLVYGLYTALFIAYIRILRRRNERVDPGDTRPAKTLYLLPTIILFVLTTLVVIGRTIYRSLYMYLAFDGAQTKNFKPFIHYLQHDPRKTTGYFFTTVCVVLLNATADYILIHRCHTIWDFRKRITIPLAVASACTFMVGIVGTSMFVNGERNTTIDKNRELAKLGNLLYGVFLVMSVVVNMLITALTAGRIWWLYHQLRGNERFFKPVLRIIIESGLIYPIFTLIHVITIQVMPFGNIPFELSCISYQTAGIAPTLMVVRAQLGKTVETKHDHDDAVTGVSEINFRSSPPPPDCSSGIDSSTQAPQADDAFNMQQARVLDSGSLDCKKKDIISVANREHAPHCATIPQTV